MEKSLGLPIAHQVWAPGMKKTTKWLRCPSKSTLGDGSPTETFEGIIKCNVLQQSVFQKTIHKHAEPNQSTTSTVPSMAMHIGYTSFFQPYNEFPPPHVHLFPVHWLLYMGEVLLPL